MCVCLCVLIVENLNEMQGEFCLMEEDGIGPNDQRSSLLWHDDSRSRSCQLHKETPIQEKNRVHKQKQRQQSEMKQTWEILKHEIYSYEVIKDRVEYSQNKKQGEAKAYGIIFQIPL